MRRLVHRSFVVGAPPWRVWEHLAEPARWPSWATHIRTVEMTPPGKIGPQSVGEIRLTNGMTSRFRMTELVEHEHWTWVGKFLWLRIRYDHAFADEGAGRCRVDFDVDVEGLGVSWLGRLFARVYGRNLNQAIPRLVAEIETGD